MGKRTQVPPGTLVMLILHALEHLEPMHGYGIGQYIQRTTENVLQIEEGSLYPALQRMLVKGWIRGEWRKSEKNRRARYYSLTAAGRRQLGLEVEEFQRVTEAIRRVVEPA